MNYSDLISEREAIIDQIESYWCERMTVLVENNQIEDSDSLYLEFVVDGEEPNEWVMTDYIRGDVF
jgi:hypothetical protein